MDAYDGGYLKSICGVEQIGNSLNRLEILIVDGSNPKKSVIINVK
jgi:hypothetical protein